MIALKPSSMTMCYTERIGRVLRSFRKAPKSHKIVVSRLSRTDLDACDVCKHATLPLSGQSLISARSRKLLVASELEGLGNCSDVLLQSSVPLITPPDAQDVRPWDRAVRALILHSPAARDPLKLPVVASPEAVEVVVVQGLSDCQERGSAPG